MIRPPGFLRCDNEGDFRFEGGLVAGLASPLYPQDTGRRSLVVARDVATREPHRLEERQATGPPLPLAASSFRKSGEPELESKFT